MNPIIIIPSRLAATRLPEKPLCLINNTPMIVHVMNLAKKASVGTVLVAAGDAAIADVIHQHGGQAVLTDPNLASGSDRIFAALKEFDSQNQHDIIINLQGDMAVFDPSILNDVLEPFKNDAVDIATLAVPIKQEEQITNPNTVKIAMSFYEETLARCLYFSRSPIPHGSDVFYHHLGVYAFRRRALAKFVSIKPSPLEKSEKLEQLRALEAGMRIDVKVTKHDAISVDTPQDLERVNHHFSLMSS